MSIGLLSVIDDVVAIAKVAAASLDDVATQATRAGVKAAGVVIDDAAVTPRYLIGFAAKRELAVIARIAVGSLRNKLLILLPIALFLSYFLPAMITPLLMIGGAYLCYEGTEKLFEAIAPHPAHRHEAQLGSIATNPKTLEDQKVASAIKTDFILSAEIMAIALAALPVSTLPVQAMVLALVGVGITALVYGAVAIIVKADDIGLALAESKNGWSATRALGRAIVRGMPTFLSILSAVGTAAMIWVGGGIILHGLESYGLPSGPIHHVVDAVASIFPPIAGAIEWLTNAAISGTVGMLVGATLIPLGGFVLAPAWQHLKGLLRFGK